jgi:hypothetical protein
MLLWVSLDPWPDNGFGLQHQHWGSLLTFIERIRLTLRLQLREVHSVRIGMKMERKRTELSGAIFVFIFLCGSRNEYRNSRNKYENGYFQKQKWNEYGTNTDEKE